MSIHSLLRLSAAASAAASLIIFAGACAARQAKVAAAEPQFTSIVIDGDTSEWPGNAAAFADEHYLYIRFTVADEQFTLQSAKRSVALAVDCDNDPATGKPMTLSGTAIGADLMAIFSPNGKNGVELVGLNSAGQRTPLEASNYDFVIAPTYASSWYEARISRTPDKNDGLPATGLLAPGSIRGFAAVLGSNDSIAAASEVFEVKTDPVCPGGKRLTAEDPPAPGTDSIRVLSWNIEMSKPVENPAPFARIIAATKPDVLLLQEWDKGDAAAVQTWFTTNIGGTWYVAKAPGTMANGGGVLIASRFELTPGPSEPITCTYRNDKGEDETRPVRFVSATINTPIGPVLAGSVHLKSRGTKDSVEDRRRMAECRAINKAMSERAAASSPPIRLVAGDMNLVGSRPPIDLLRASIDTDGTDMSAADAMVHGDQAYYTWKDSGTPFTPGRLDWMVYSDATVKSRQAFVLDTSRLSTEVLTKLKLEAGDSAAADHLPVIVDFAKR
jgi:exonuclease III